MIEQIVIAGPASQALAMKVANLLKCNILSTENKIFPDGESYLRISIDDNSIIENKDVIIIQTTGANSSGDQNRRIMELIMIISAAKQAGAQKIRVVVPYLAYSRQDNAFRPGECKFAIELLRWIEIAGATEFYTIDIHSKKVLESMKIPTYNLDPMKYFAQEIKEKNIKDLLVICPDKGAYERSREFAKNLGEDVPVVQFIKKRDVKTGELTMEGDLPFTGKNVLIADDIIATGGTLAKAIKIAKKGCPKSIYLLGTHNLLLNNAIFNLMEAGTEEILGTDTLESPSKHISMADLIANAILTN